MHGNVFTWCQEGYRNYPMAAAFEETDDVEAELAVGPAVSRVLRGGSFFFQASLLRSAHRAGNVPADRFLNNGFRVARTLGP